jgi:hypothetical protein
MAQLWKVRLPNGNVFHPTDWTAAEPLYSSVEIGTSAFPVLTAFSYPIGGAVPGSPTQRQSTLADTNLKGEGARLPQNEQCIAYSLSIECFMIGPESDTSDASGLPHVDPPFVSVANMLRLQRDLLVITKLAGTREYTRSPMSWFPAAAGVHMANSAARTQRSNGANGFAVAANGGTEVCDRRNFASPMYIAGGETLSVEVRPGPGQVDNLDLATDSRVRLRIFFEGYRARPVS